jgi:hypothetical protein
MSPSAVGQPGPFVHRRTRAAAVGQQQRAVRRLGPAPAGAGRRLAGLQAPPYPHPHDVNVGRAVQAGERLAGIAGPDRAAALAVVHVEFGVRLGLIWVEALAGQIPPPGRRHVTGRGDDRVPARRGGHAEAALIDVHDVGNRRAERGQDRAEPE